MLPQTAPDRLDGLQVQRGRLAVDALADVVAEPLTDDRRNFLVPQDRADFEADRVAGDFGIDLAVTERGVERLDGAKIFNGCDPSLAAGRNGLRARRR